MKEKLKSYTQLVKLRLTITIVATSVFGYIIACQFHSRESIYEHFEWMEFMGVCLGGLLIVFSSNGLNQLIEIENDSKMKRTENRPLVEGRLSVKEARNFSIICGILGLLVLAITTNFATTLWGLVSLSLYVFVYTPMKQVSPFAVLVGAVPGGLPPLIGYSAVSAKLDEIGMVLFFVQFFWQFPHFWAIAWLLHDDYQRAGYWLLPGRGGRDKRSAYQIMIYTIVLVMVTLLPYKLGLINGWGMLVLLPMGLYFIYRSYKLFRSMEIKDAKRLLFSSLIYTPVVFLAYIIF